MGYYENPPIINFTEGYNQVTAGIIDATKSITEALIKKGERERLSIEKLQQQKNETDLEYNNKLSQWDSKTPIQNKDINSKIHNILQQKIQIAADAKIALLSETNNEKRQEYLKHIRNADVFMNNAAEFAKNVAMDSATWRENASAVTIGVPNGWVVNGKDSREIMARTGALEIIGGMDQMYENSSIDIEDTGDSFKLLVRGKRKGSTESFEMPIDASSYLKSDTEGGGGFLQKVENIDEFVKSSKKNLVDEKGDLFETFKTQEEETAKLGNGYERIYGRRLKTDEIKTEISKQAYIKAQGYLRAGKESSLRSLLNYTLEQGPEYYDAEFKGKFTTVEAQTAKLAELLTEKSFQSITRDHRTSKEGDKDVYWSVDSKVSKIEEPSTSGKGGKGNAGSQSGEVQIFDQPQIDKYMQAYARAFENKDEPFIISWTGARGGQNEETFQFYNGKVRRIDGGSAIAFNNSKEFRDYLRSKKTVKKTPLKA